MAEDWANFEVDTVSVTIDSISAPPSDVEETLRSVFQSLGLEFCLLSVLKTHRHLPFPDRARCSFTICGRSVELYLLLDQIDWRKQPDVECSHPLAQAIPLLSLHALQNWKDSGFDDFRGLIEEIYHQLDTLSRRYILSSGQISPTSEDDVMEVDSEDNAFTWRRLAKELHGLDGRLQRVFLDGLSTPTTTVCLQMSLSEPQSKVLAALRHITERVLARRVFSVAKSEIGSTYEEPRLTVWIDVGSMSAREASLQLDNRTLEWLPSAPRVPTINLRCSIASAVSSIENELYDEIWAWSFRMRLVSELINELTTPIEIDTKHYKTASFLLEKTSWPCVVSLTLTGRKPIRLDKLIFTSLLSFQINEARKSPLAMEEMIFNSDDIGFDESWTPTAYAEKIKSFVVETVYRT